MGPTNLSTSEPRRGTRRFRFLIPLLLAVGMDPPAGYLWAQSVAELETAVLLDPDDAGVRGALGRLFHEEGQLDRAILEYQAAIRLAPAEVRFYLGLAAVFETANLNDEAVTLLVRTAEAFPRSLPAKVRLAEAQFVVGEIESALRTFYAARLMAEGPDRIEELPIEARTYIHRRIGDTHVHLIEFDDAFDAFARAMALDPRDLPVHLALGTLYLRRNRLDEAADLYARAVELDPGEPAAYHGMAEARLRQGRFGESVAAADAALELDAGHLGARYVRAMALIRSGQPEAGAEALEAYRALEEAARARDHREREIGGAYKAAIAQSLDGNGDEAVRILRDALAVYPDAREIHFNLGSVLLNLGRYTESAEVFRGMIDMGWGDDPAVGRNLDRATRRAR